MTVVPRCGPAGLPQLSANSLQKPIPLSQIDAADNVAVARASQSRGG